MAFARRSFLASVLTVAGAAVGLAVWIFLQTWLADDPELDWRYYLAFSGLLGVIGVLMLRGGRALAGSHRR
jgi:MFS family permease